MLSEIEQFIDRVRMRSPQAKTWRDYRSDLMARRGQPLSPLSGRFTGALRSAGETHDELRGTRSL